jgi:hypothetical protein
MPKKPKRMYKRKIHFEESASDIHAHTHENKVHDDDSDDRHIKTCASSVKNSEDRQTDRERKSCGTNACGHMRSEMFRIHLRAFLVICAEIETCISIRSNV